MLQNTPKSEERFQQMPLKVQKDDDWAGVLEPATDLPDDVVPRFDDFLAVISQQTWMSATKALFLA
jgi:hypothetical protein